MSIWLVYGLKYYIIQSNFLIINFYLTKKNLEPYGGFIIYINLYKLLSSTNYFCCPRDFIKWNFHYINYLCNKALQCMYNY